MYSFKAIHFILVVCYTASLYNFNQANCKGVISHILHVPLISKLSTWHNASAPRNASELHLVFPTNNYILEFRELDRPINRWSYNSKIQLNTEIYTRTPLRTYISWKPIVGENRPEFTAVDGESSPALQYIILALSSLSGCIQFILKLQGRKVFPFYWCRWNGLLEWWLYVCCWWWMMSIKGGYWLLMLSSLAITHFTKNLANRYVRTLWLF